MCEWYGTVLPDCFACPSTVPSGSLPGMKARLATIPARFSACTAPASVVLETSGTVAVRGGGGAVAVVVEAVVVASVAVVVDCGSACATRSVTGVPRVSVVPAWGACARTVPAGSLLACEVTAG